MSEQSGPYETTLASRVDALETLGEQHTHAIGALINAIDQLRANMNMRLLSIDGRLSAIEESNKLLIELISSRLPPLAKDE